MTPTAKWIIGIVVVVLVTFAVLVWMNVISSSGDDYMDRNRIVETG